MAIYPQSETDRRVAMADLRRVVTDIFGACGMSGEDAYLLANTLVHADLRGVHSHGTLRVPDYVKKLTKDGVNPRGRPRIVGGRGAAIVVYADNSMGQIAGTFAMQAAVARARAWNCLCGRTRLEQLRGDGLVHTDGRPRRHDRSCRHQCASHNGALGRLGEDRRHQSLVRLDRS